MKSDELANAYVIKGFLQAHRAPSELISGIDRIIDRLSSPTSVFLPSFEVEKQEVKRITRSKKQEIPDNVTDLAHSGKNKPKTDEIIPFGNIPDIEKQAEANVLAVRGSHDAPGFAACVQEEVRSLQRAEEEKVAGPLDDQPKKKRRGPPWTPERREKQRQVMKALHKRQKMGWNTKQGQAAAPAPSAETLDDEPEDPDPVAIAVQKTDFLGEPLVDVSAAPPIAAPSRMEPRRMPGMDGYTPRERPSYKEYAGKRSDGALYPGDLVDIHEMLSQGKTTAQIAESYGCKKEELEAFILQHKNVQITRCAPGRFTGDNVIRPTYRNGGSY